MALDVGKQPTRYIVQQADGGLWDGYGELNCFIEDGALVFCMRADRLLKAFAPGQWLSVHQEVWYQDEWVAPRHALQGGHVRAHRETSSA